MNQEIIRPKYLANQEFRKNIRHNGHDYLLRSVFDEDNTKFGFDTAIAKYNHKTRTFNFDDSIQKYLYNTYNLQDDLDAIYNTGLLD